jgi:hypothetical protein
MDRAKTWIIVTRIDPIQTFSLVSSQNGKIPSLYLSKKSVLGCGSIDIAI